MSHELICSWLGLPPDCWPPDHYRLLGLPTGESDVARIEQQVHQRIETLRRYQMMYPEQATEAMNRLAQAFVCLTEPAAKKAYDEQVLGSVGGVQGLGGVPPPKTPGPIPQARSDLTPPPVRAVPPPLPAPAATEPDNPHVWLGTPGANGPAPPPIRVPPPVRVPPPLPVAPPTEEQQPAAPPEPPPPPAEPIDPIREAAQRSEAARRGLASRPALHRRVLLTRKLLRLWHRLGAHLDDPDRKLTRGEAAAMKKVLDQIEEDGTTFPLLGEAGQPGYLILSLTQFDRSKDLLSLDRAVRESLKRDWEAGLKFLEFHRDFLRAELAAYRQRGRGERLVLAARAWLNDRPMVALLIFGGVLAVMLAWITYWWKTAM